MTTLISGTCQCGNKIRGAKNYCTKCRKALEHRLGETSDDYTIRTASLLGNTAEAERAQRRKTVFATIWEDPDYVRLHEKKDLCWSRLSRARSYHPEQVPGLERTYGVLVHRIQDYEDAKIARARG